MSDFCYTEMDWDERPKHGYIFIYIYSCDNLYIYVGQTRQSLKKRFYNHLSDNSGAHYTNCIAYFQVHENYANYAEGYMARRVKGICQGNVPNPDYHKHCVPKNIRKTLQLIGNKLCNRKSDDEYLKTGELPLFSFNLENNEIKRNTLEFLNLLCEEHSILKKTYGIYDLHNYDLYNYDFEVGDISSHLIFRPEKDFRPIIFFECNNVMQIKQVIHLFTNFPIYCCISNKIFKKYKSHFERIFKKDSVLAGLLIKDYFEYEVKYYYSNPYKRVLKRKNMYDFFSAKDLIPYCKKTVYKIRTSAYAEFRCA